MASYLVTVYLADDLTGSEMQDRFSIPLTRLLTREVEETDPKSAAATAWIEASGQYRFRHLAKMNAPEHIKDVEMSQAYVAGSLTSFPLSIDARFAFIFDNGVEAWLIGVDFSD